MTVVIAYLPTREGDAAFAAGVGEATRRNEPLIAVNSPRTGAPITDTLANEDTLARLRERAAAANVPFEVRQEGHTDDLVELLLAVADEVEASVLVLGLRRRTAVGKLLMGSTAQRILLQSERPVLAVKAPLS